MNIGGEGKSAKYQFSLGPDDASTNGFKLEVNVAAGAMNGKFVGVGETTARNQWYYLDIPVSTLVDEDGDFGFVYDFVTTFAQKPIFTCGFDVDDASCTKYTAGAVDPDTGMKTITIREIGEGSVYNLSGQKVDGSYKGIVMQNGKKYIRKH